MSIREHIINNFKDDDVSVLEKAIDQSIEEKDELTLPGMGVFLELLWKNADRDLKDKILNIIISELKNSSK